MACVAALIYMKLVHVSHLGVLLLSGGTAAAYGAPLMTRLRSTSLVFARTRRWAAVPGHGKYCDV